MFGLKESGFIISLGVTLLLSGLITFYIKQRTSEIDEKTDQILKMVQEVASETNRQNMVINGMLGSNVTTGGVVSGAAGGPVENELSNDQLGRNDLIPVSTDSEISETSDEDVDSDEDSDEDSDPDSNNESPLQMKVIDFNNIDEGLGEVLTGKVIVNIENDNLDKTNVHEDSLIEEENNNDVPLVTETTENDVDDEQTEDTTHDDTTEDNDSVANLETDINYSKLTVKALKSLALEKGILIPAKVKKDELINLLSN